MLRVYALYLVTRIFNRLFVDSNYDNYNDIINFDLYQDLHVKLLEGQEESDKSLCERRFSLYRSVDLLLLFIPVSLGVHKICQF